MIAASCIARFRSSDMKHSMFLQELVHQSVFIFEAIFTGLEKYESAVTPVYTDSCGFPLSGGLSRQALANTYIRRMW